MMSTVRMPVAGSAMKGRARSSSPKLSAPVNSSIPDRKIIRAIRFCSRAAALMPSTLTTVMTMALPAPMRKKPKSTSASSTRHRVPMRMPGAKYSMAVGSATATNRHTAI